MGGLECVITGLMDEFKGFFTKYRIRNSVGSIPHFTEFATHSAQEVLTKWITKLVCQMR